MRPLALLALLPLPALAGDADVLDATAEALGGGQWRISATVQHADTGWDHYANGFEIVGPDGEVLGTRVLYHPHVEEQPFTRSHTLAIPEGITEITVRALDSVHGGEGGAEVTVPLQ